MGKRSAQITLEIIWNDEKDDHPLNWDWEFLVNPGKLISTNVVDREGEGWIVDESS